MYVRNTCEEYMQVGVEYVGSRICIENCVQKEMDVDYYDAQKMYSLN